MEIEKRFEENLNNKELVEIMASIDDSIANQFMDMAIRDTNKIFQNKNIAKSEISYRIYRAYLLGYSLCKYESKNENN